MSEANCGQFTATNQNGYRGYPTATPYCFVAGTCANSDGTSGTVTVNGVDYTFSSKPWRYCMSNTDIYGGMQWKIKPYDHASQAYKFLSPSHATQGFDETVCIRCTFGLGSGQEKNVVQPNVRIK